MNQKRMSKIALITAIICAVATVIVFVLADGLRRWYSGIFFAVLTLVMLVNTRRWRRVADGKHHPWAANRSSRKRQRAR